VNSIRGHTVDNRRETVRNSEQRSMGKSRRIQNRRKSRVGPLRNSFDEAKGRERTEKKRGGGIGIKLFIYFALQMGSLLYRKQFNNESYY
jgi:hypothetical protein